MKFVVMTLFPDMLENILSQSIIGRAQASGAISVECVNIRDYSKDKHRKTDDTPYGGGRGMIMTCQPIVDCHRAITSSLTGSVHTVYMSPQGKTLTQEKACQLKNYDNLVILCGHYEGVDERALEMTVDEEISIGDYVLTGGELPAAVLVDCVARTVEGVLVSDECYINESHYDGLLEYPQYTKPYDYEGHTVPEILLSGHHENIDKWRGETALERTAQKRPDMIEKFKKS
ncbi:MAG TPA: tRNA (guanosine(37)-N1)-methyltransferase TrmD [Bacillota bacterium]|nr:tRNA (guanosine(37)-N1)-methyltransferase TrmD [Bacillota bacterium]